MDLNLENKTALVCGSSKGIGKAAAVELSKLGANLILIARSKQLLQNLMSELECTKKQKHQYISHDLRNLEALRSKLNDILNHGNIHILVNNAGGPSPGEILAATVNDFTAAMELHLASSHSLTQLVWKGMKADGYGRIINVLSTSVKAPLQNLGVSNTLRGAMANWAKSLANELGPWGITVNNVLPGFTSTERLDQIVNLKCSQQNLKKGEMIHKMTKTVPMKRFGKPAEIAAAIAFLASPAASYITGTNITVDGGRTASL